MKKYLHIALASLLGAFLLMVALVPLSRVCIPCGYNQQEITLNILIAFLGSSFLVAGGGLFASYKFFFALAMNYFFLSLYVFSNNITLLFLHGMGRLLSLQFWGSFPFALLFVYASLRTYHAFAVRAGAEKSPTLHYN